MQIEQFPLIFRRPPKVCRLFRCYSRPLLLLGATIKSTRHAIGRASTQNAKLVAFHAAEISSFFLPSSKAQRTPQRQSQGDAATFAKQAKTCSTSVVGDSASCTLSRPSINGASLVGPHLHAPVPSQLPMILIQIFYDSHSCLPLLVNRSDATTFWRDHSGWAENSKGNLITISLEQQFGCRANGETSRDRVRVGTKCCG